MDEDKVVLSGIACLNCVLKISRSFSARNDYPRDKGILFSTDHSNSREEICPICGKHGWLLEFSCTE